MLKKIKLKPLKRNEYIYKITRFLSKILLWPFFNIEIKGLENIPENAFILLPKHQKWVDVPIISIAAPRSLYYIAKYELFNNPISRLLITSLGGLSLNRERPIESRRSLVKMLEHLRNGEGIVVFPEGTYYKNKMGPGNLGVIRLIVSRMNIPFVPVGISYKRNRFRTKARVILGTPIIEDYSKTPEVLLKQIIKNIAKLSGLTN